MVSIENLLPRVKSGRLEFPGLDSGFQTVSNRFRSGSNNCKIEQLTDMVSIENLLPGVKSGLLEPPGLDSGFQAVSKRFPSGSSSCKSEQLTD